MEEFIINRIEELCKDYYKTPFKKDKISIICAIGHNLKILESDKTITETLKEYEKRRTIMGFIVKKASLNEVVFMDFETTGLKAGFHRAIEVGALLVINNEPVKEFRPWVRGDCHVRLDAGCTHGLAEVDGHVDADRDLRGVVCGNCGGDSGDIVSGEVKGVG